VTTESAVNSTVNRILKFVRTTLAGGVLFLLPVVVVVIIVGKALAIAREIVTPLATRLPVESVIGLATPKLLAITLLVLLCFLAGVFARTRLAQKMVARLETTVLFNVPGYEFFKGVSRSLLGQEKHLAHPVVLARIEDAWQIALLMERLEGGHVAVFVPDVPSPQSGSLYFMTEDRIKLMDVPSAAAMKCLKRYGLDSNAPLGKQLALLNQETKSGVSDTGE
jgi:uncharacterized membrane protein